MKAKGVARGFVRGAMHRGGILMLVGLLTACAVEPPAPVVVPHPAPAPVPSIPAPAEQATFAQSGLASIYAVNQQGHRTASGEPLNNYAMSAAHRSLPFYTVARVTVPSTGKTVKVRINDRGPFIPGRIVDLSQAAAKALGILDRGTAPVRVEVFASDQ